MSNKKSKNKEATQEVIVAWSEEAWEDYLYWQKEDFSKVEKINALLDECMRDPFGGTGKPEPLKGNLADFWWRRIDREHRLVYMMIDGVVHIAPCRFHY